MENTYILNALPLDFSGETDIEMAIYGTDNSEKREKEKIVSVLNRYVENKNVGNNQLAYMTGIDKGEISRYLNGERQINRGNLCLICIALRLMTCQQKYLFDLLKEPMPCSIGKPDKWEYIVKHFMDGCYYNENYTVARCNESLNAAGEIMLSLLTSTKGAKQ